MDDDILAVEGVPAVLDRAQLGAVRVMEAGSRSWWRSCRRRAASLPFPRPLIVLSGGDIQTFSARAQGAGGTFLFAMQAPRLGSQVRVEFDLGLAGYLSVMGTVVRVETGTDAGRSGFAIRFEIDDQARAAISRQLQAG